MDEMMRIEGDAVAAEIVARFIRELDEVIRVIEGPALPIPVVPGRPALVTEPVQPSAEL